MENKLPQGDPALPFSPSLEGGSFDDGSSLLSMGPSDPVNTELDWTHVSDARSTLPSLEKGGNAKGRPQRDRHPTRHVLRDNQTHTANGMGKPRVLVVSRRHLRKDKVRKRIGNDARERWRARTESCRKERKRDTKRDRTQWKRCHVHARGKRDGAVRWCSRKEGDARGLDARDERLLGKSERDGTRRELKGIEEERNDTCGSDAFHSSCRTCGNGCSRTVQC